MTARDWLLLAASPALAVVGVAQKSDNLFGIGLCGCFVVICRYLWREIADIRRSEKPQWRHRTETLLALYAVSAVLLLSVFVGAAAGSGFVFGITLCGAIAVVALDVRRDIEITRRVTAAVARMHHGDAVAVDVRSESQ